MFRSTSTVLGVVEVVDGQSVSKEPVSRGIQVVACMPASAGLERMCQMLRLIELHGHQIFSSHRKLTVLRLTQFNKMCQIRLIKKYGILMLH